jgi:choline kinase
MKAIILAAGHGSRLRPYTDDKPKCMVELAGRPLLHRQLATLRGAGVEDILLVGGYRADKLESDGFRIALNPRHAETNMVSTLFCAEDSMRPGEDLLIAYGDIVYEPRVLRSLLDTDAPVAICVDREWRRFWAARMDDPLADAETLKLAGGDRVVELGKKPKGYDEIQGQYMGLIKVRGDHVETFRNAWHALDRRAMYDGKDFDNMYMTSFLQHLIESGVEVRAAFTDNGWLEVDTVEDLERYDRMQREGTLATFIRLDD